MRRMLNIHEVNDFRLDKIDNPTPGKSDVVIKVKSCGVCGSDLSYIKWGGIMRKPGGTTPLGHEAAGEVSYVGSDVKGVKVGQRMIINPMMTPSSIGSGGPEGAFTDEVLVADARVGDSLLPIPEDVPYEVAALTEPLAVALHGVNRSQAKAGEKVVVFGCGPIGLGMVLWLADRGVKNLVALDLADERLERAKALGASAVINPSRENVIERLFELHGKSNYMYRDRVGTDAFIDAAGAPNIVPDVIKVGKMHARLVITAAYGKPVQLDLGTMLTGEMTLTTACGYPTEMPDVVAAMPRLRDKLKTLISHRYSLDQVIEAFGVAGTPGSAKVMVNI